MVKGKIQTAPAHMISRYNKYKFKLNCIIYFNTVTFNEIGIIVAQMTQVHALRI